jgi:hypothetical protein
MSLRNTGTGKRREEQQQHYYGDDSNKHTHTVSRKPLRHVERLGVYGRIMLQLVLLHSVGWQQTPPARYNDPNSKFGNFLPTWSQMFTRGQHRDNHGQVNNQSTELENGETLLKSVCNPVHAYCDVTGWAALDVVRRLEPTDTFTDNVYHLSSFETQVELHARKHV